MVKRKGYKYLSMFLVIAMLLTMLLPMTAYAAGITTIEETEFVDTDTDSDHSSVPAVDSEETEGSENVQETFDMIEIEESVGETSKETKEGKNTGNSTQDVTALSEITNYSDFLTQLAVLERYADVYAETNKADATLLIINFIRTGKESYNDGNWDIMAGEANNAFISYVLEQDSVNGTSASALRCMSDFVLPNSQTADFYHMFATLNIAYYKNNEGTADFGGWAGDICDLMDYANSKGMTTVEIDDAVTEINENYFGVDDPEYHSFGLLDLRGDLDAYYIYTTLKNSGDRMSNIFSNYFTADLTDETRAAFFLNNRFPGNTTQEKVRTAILRSYGSNNLAQALEASRSLSELSNIETLRTACCYVFADWCYETGKDKLVEVDPVDPEPTPEPEEGYYSVFSSNTTTLAPGVTQTVNYALTKDDKQIVYYIADVDVARDDVQVCANYHANDPSKGWAMSRVSDQMAAAQARHSDASDTERYIENYNAILGVNADFYDMTTGAPQGALIMEGVEYHGVGHENFFAILKDGTAVIGGGSEYAAYKDQIQEAVGGSNYLVKNGKSVVTASSDYYKNRHSRTCVGITAEGRVVFMVLDGRQEPFSVGGSAEEIAQIMVDAGCVTAINLDGGGSTSFVAKQEGSDEISVVNRPSDGYERSVSSSLLVVSTASVSTEFDHGLIASDYDYLTVGASTQLSASGVSASGNAAELPTDTVWQSSDETIGSVSEDGIFTAVKTGNVEIQLVHNDVVVGRKTLNVVAPDGLKFSKNSVNAIYGKAIYLPLIATYKENPVAICPSDIQLELSKSNAGKVEADDTGFRFTGNEDSGLKSTTVTAMLSRDYSISATIKITMYNENQAIFDFDNSTAGDRTFAWTRSVSNSELVSFGENEADYYHVIDPSADMDVTYVFGLDMTTIDVPEKLQPLLSMVAGGDLSGITAWDMLLQLAERVSALTEVTVKIQFDKNLSVDYSNLTVSNDYFQKSSATLDENNLLTVKCNWIKQGQAIEPDTANPICILSGIKLGIKEDAAWDTDKCLNVTNSGSVGYDIYLGANALYSMSSQPSFQQQYDIYPYTEPENTVHPAGGHFYCEEYKAFADRFILDNTSWTGWKTLNGASYYFTDNVILKGVHKVPDPNDGTKEYYYSFNEASGVSKGRVTGLFQSNGEQYYAINGEVKSGWWLIPDSNGEDCYYYFDTKTNKGLNGKTDQFYKNVVYEFENGKLLHGVWVTTDSGTKYYYGPSYVQGKWYTISGNQYYFDNNGNRYEGYHYIKERDNHDDPLFWYDFGEDGICKGVYQHTGLFVLGDNTYYILNGQVYNGLVLAEDGYYYYFSTSNYAAVKNTRYWVSYPNDTGFAQTFYNFDEQGRMIDPPAKDELDTSKNGIVKEDGQLYYYVKGVKTYVGLVQIDGDYYYVNSACKVVTNAHYWISKTNDLLPATFYDFDADGKMINPPKPDPTPDPGKNGIVKEDGELYYYVDGIKTYAGLIQIDGDYYYVNSYCKVVTDTRYWISKTNDLLPATFYDFDADGKMINPPKPDPTPDPGKNGIVKEDGELYYYVNGVKTYAGLIQIDDDYYYVNSYCKVVTDTRYWISKTNDLLPATFYNFDETGKIVF